MNNFATLQAVEAWHAGRNTSLAGLPDWGAGLAGVAGLQHRTEVPAGLCWTPLYCVGQVDPVQADTAVDYYVTGRVLASRLCTVLHTTFRPKV